MQPGAEMRLAIAPRSSWRRLGFVVGCLVSLSTPVVAVICQYFERVMFENRNPLFSTRLLFVYDAARWMSLVMSPVAIVLLIWCGSRLKLGAVGREELDEYPRPLVRAVIFICLLYALCLQTITFVAGNLLFSSIWMLEYFSKSFMGVALLLFSRIQTKRKRIAFSQQYRWEGLASLACIQSLFWAELFGASALVFLVAVPFGIGLAISAIRRPGKLNKAAATISLCWSALALLVSIPAVLWR
jgi:hypothetical protein